MNEHLIDRYAWLLFIVVTCLNGLVWWVRGRHRRRQDPGLVDEYKNLIRGFLIWANVPWLAMALILLSGRADSMSEFLHPRHGNPFVLVWLAVILALWVVGTRWMLAGGAEKLARCPGLLNEPFTTAPAIKGIWVVSVVAGTIALALLVSGRW